MDEQVKVDTELLSETKKLLGEYDADRAVTRVLERYCEARRKHQDLFDIAGTIEFANDFDPKSTRFTRYDPN